MKRIMKIFLCTALAVITVAAAIMPICAYAEETSAEVSYENRAEIEQKILDFIEENKEATPAVSITVFDGNQDICNVIYGEANIEEGLAADENTVYEWGSVSKLLAWTSAMQLYEQGKLDLEEDIRTYLPSGFLKNCTYDDPITMIDLMNHGAGFQETVAKIESEDINDLIPLDEALKSTAPAQTFRPGETVSYSNWSAALGGYVVSRVSGMDYADYVDENIFGRLGMEKTSMRPDMSDNEWVAEQRKNLHCYMESMENMNSLEDQGECRRYINLYPAGSACGTISDMALFAKALLCDSKDCPLFEKDDTLDIMLSPSWTFADGTPRICHGMFYTPIGDGLYGHGGNTAGCSADLQLDLKNKKGYVMLTNTEGDRIYSSGLPTLLFGEESVPTESGFTKTDISGHYKIGRSCGGVGILKIMSPFEDNLKISASGNDFTGERGITKITQISDTFVEAELINGAKHYYGIKKNADGSVFALESFQAVDFVKQSSTGYYTDMVMLILFAASLAVMSVMFIVHLICLRKFKNQPTAAFKKSELMATLAALAIVIEFVVVLTNSYQLFYGGTAVYAVICILFCVFALAEAVMLVRCHLNSEKPQSRILLNIETACSVLTIVGIMYWSIYQFWGF